MSSKVKILLGITRCILCIFVHKMRIRIIVSVTNDLVSDQRVHKVCKTLQEVGLDVLLVGRRFKGSEEVKRTYQTYRMKLLFNSGPLFYLEFNLRLFWFLLFQKHTLLLSNDLDTLLPNFIASKLKRSVLIYDSHELFPEAPELQKRPFVKSIWENLERFLLPQLKHAYTVCRSIADHYLKQYGLRMEVIRNVPFRKMKTEHEKKQKILIYQGVINPGRGLELAIETLVYLNDYKLLIVGGGQGLYELKELAKLKGVDQQVEFVGRVPFEELEKYTAQASIGLLLEEPLGKSFEYALPNKLFDYIHADLPFVASDLIEVNRIVEEYGVGEILKERTPLSLAKQIKNISVVNLEKYKKAQNQLCWEKEQIVLRDLIVPLIK